MTGRNWKALGMREIPSPSPRSSPSGLCITHNFLLTKHCILHLYLYRYFDVVSGCDNLRDKKTVIITVFLNLNPPPGRYAN